MTRYAKGPFAVDWEDRYDFAARRRRRVERAQRAPILCEFRNGFGILVAEPALQLSLQYAKERKAFGRPLGSFQHNRFKLAEARTKVDIGRVFVDRLLQEHVEGNLTIEQAAEAEWWTTVGMST